MDIATPAQTEAPPPRSVGTRFSAHQSRTHPLPLASTRDRFSALPPELISHIFGHLDHGTPVPALSRHLLPCARAVNFAHGFIWRARQLDSLVRMLKGIPALGAYVHILGLLTRPSDKADPDSFVDLLRLAPNVQILCITDTVASLAMLSERAVDSGGANLRDLDLSLGLDQVISPDFIPSRVALLSRYPLLRTLHLTVLGFLTDNAQGVSARDLQCPVDYTAPVAHVDSLRIFAPLSDHHVVEFVRAFRGLKEVELVDAYSSQHRAPVLAALDASEVRRLVLHESEHVFIRLDLPPLPTDWSRFAQLSELDIGVLIDYEKLVAAFPSFDTLSSVRFAPGSAPPATFVRQLLTAGLPRLRKVELSNLTGKVGAPIRRKDLPAVEAFVAARHAAYAAAFPQPPTAGPEFPLEDWTVPRWTVSFGPDDVRSLFSLARSVGVKMDGTVVDAYATHIVLQTQFHAREVYYKWEQKMLRHPAGLQVMAERQRARLLGEETSDEASESAEEGDDEEWEDTEDDEEVDGEWGEGEGQDASDEERRD